MLAAANETVDQYQSLYLPANRRYRFVVNTLRTVEQADMRVEVLVDAVLNIRAPGGAPTAR